MPDTEPLSFDLLHEPWIPCERPDGTRVLVGIEAALVEAHTFAALHDESPLATAMLHRLLLAILQRVFLPKTMEDWVALWEVEAFDATRVRAYLGQWKERFDLFHPERPFLQVAKLAEVLKKERGSDPEPTFAWRLAMEASVYSNAAHLFEALPPEPDLAPAKAALALLGFLAFTYGGRINNETASWAQGNVRPGAVVLVRGATLRQTLLLNLLWRREASPKDLPPWECDESATRATRAPFGTVDQLIWQSRRVQLLGARDALGRTFVREAVTAAGARPDGDHPDPMFAYFVRDAEQGPVAMRIERDRAAWRDATAIFEAAASKRDFRRPRACEQLATLIDEGIVAREARFAVEVLGLATAPGKPQIRLWRAERLPLPLALLKDGTRVAALRLALTLAEDLGKELDYDVLGVLARNGLAPSQLPPAERVA
jgi:CRISPR system Cascade subunit CasA